MKSLRGACSWVTIAVLFLLPSVALAEVSVQLDGHGNFKRTWYLTGGKGRSAFVWNTFMKNTEARLAMQRCGFSQQP